MVILNFCDAQHGMLNCILTNLLQNDWFGWYADITRENSEHFSVAKSQELVRYSTPKLRSSLEKEIVKKSQSLSHVKIEPEVIFASGKLVQPRKKEGWRWMTEVGYLR